VTAPAPYVRKAFHLKGPVQSASLVITALGLYEAEINGQRVGDQVFAPGWTDYLKRVPYQRHDVAAVLRQGENAIGAILGDGWYCGNLAWKGRQIYGDRPMLLAKLEIVYENGERAVIVTDSTWKTSTGPILESDLIMGEAYDARLELGPWSEPGYNDFAWQPVCEMADPGIALVTTPAPPVRRIEEIAPVSVSPAHVFDLGQNFCGRVRVTVRAKRGSTLVIRHAEVLNPNGTPYTENLREARATDYYTCGGGEAETWEPRFTFHGFRYVEVVGLEPEESVEITGIVLHSDTKPTGVFACSHPLLNQLQHNIVWGQKSNFLEVPTDCPQRNERLGWTGDAQVFIRTACFNMDVRGFFHKWLEVMRDCQHPNGGVPSVIPDKNFLGWWGSDDGGPAWSDAAIICPWTIYLCYGDRTILEEHYEAMRRYMDFMARERCKGFIRSHPEGDAWGGYGDWLALDGSGVLEGATPKDLIGTAFYAYDAAIMSKTAKVLGFEKESQEYEVLHGKIVEAFRRRFVTPEGLVASGTQTSYVLGLNFGLIPEDARPTAVAELVRNIEKRGCHIGTGFVGTPYILDVLEANGHLDLAYKLLEQETFPSWLFPVKNGATTIWERWDGWTPDKGFQDKGMNSFNHYAYGAVGAWMYRSVAGLDVDPEEPGYRHIIFRPRPGGSIGWAEARLNTPLGEAAIRWDITDEALAVQLTVPAAAHATFLPPAGYVGDELTFGPGDHRIALPRV